MTLLNRQQPCRGLYPKFQGEIEREREHSSYYPCRTVSNEVTQLRRRSISLENTKIETDG